MNPLFVISIILGYFGLLLLVSHFSSRDAGSRTFFTANRKSPWFLVAFGMIGATLSGITFISVPGYVGKSQFSYFQIVLGYTLGIFVIALVLLPLYYRLQLVSIYTYLERRFGFWSYKTGAAFFLVAQSLNAALRLYLMATVLQLAFFDAVGIPLEITVLLMLILIWLYTYRSGIKTIVYTDTLQTIFILLAVVVSIYLIAGKLDLSGVGLVHLLRDSPRARIFVWDWHSQQNFFKLLLTGMFLMIVTNGLDQSVMQKHLTCKNLKDAQKNMFVFSIMLMLANFLFLFLGLVLYEYASAQGIPIPAKTDNLFPMLALHHLGPLAGIVFLLGISAAAYSSADSALTALTTSFCVDFLGFADKADNITRTSRFAIHFGITIYLYVVILCFQHLINESTIEAFIRIAGYTYGPLLGLFMFGMCTRIRIVDRWVPFLCILSLVFSVVLYFNSQKWLWGYKFGFEILLVNAAFTFVGLLCLRKRPT